MPIRRVALSCSLAAIAGTAWGGPFGDLAARLDRAHTSAEKLDVLSRSTIDDQQFREHVIQAEDKGQIQLQRAIDYVDLRAMGEQGSEGSGYAARAHEIKSSAQYRDEGLKQSSNWLSGAASRLKNLVPKPREGEGIASPGMAEIGGFANVIVTTVWILLAAGVIAFIVYALRFVSFGKLRKRKAKALLEDSEPERTLDEWLALADALEREGRYREAVRALYLACLLRFDERNIARFRREQTNWEHLARIEASPRTPSGLAFREATRSFDQVWYGHKVRGRSDLDDFRRWYADVTSALAAVPA